MRFEGHAHSTGLKKLAYIDEVVEGDDLQAAAIKYANDLVASGAPLKRVRDITIDASTIEPGFFEAARKKLALRARGQIAPDKIVSCIEAAVNLPMDEGLQRERELFTSGLYLLHRRCVVNRMRGSPIDLPG